MTTTVRRLVRGTALAVALWLASAGAAAAGTVPTRLELSVPPSTDLGAATDVQARLTDASGQPIARAAVRFVTRLSFLEAAGDVVLADARTDERGVATAQIELRTAGTLTIAARYDGDERYAAAAAATGVIAVRAGDQLYLEHAGVHVPILNGPPQLAPVALSEPAGGILSFIAHLWPFASGWPVAAALLIVWSLYAFAASLIFRIAYADRPGPKGTSRPPAATRERSWTAR